MLSLTMNRRRLLGFSVASLAIAAVTSCTSGQGDSQVASSNVLTNRSVTLSIVPAASQTHKGADGNFHSAMVPSDFTVQSGALTYLSIVNYSPNSHSFDVPQLSLNIDIQAGSEAKPFKTTLAFTPSTPGVYTWRCERQCDGDMGNWAMSANYGMMSGMPGFMSGLITVS